MAEAVDHVNEDLETLKSLSEMYNIKLNPEKSKILCVVSKATTIYVKNNAKIYLGRINLQFFEFAKKFEGLLLKKI